MQFIAELVSKKWKNNNIATLKFQHNANQFYKGNKLIINKTSKATTILDDF